jgi:hypothetical protein
MNTGRRGARSLHRDVETVWERLRAGYDTGRHGLAQRYYITALRAAHSADNRPLGAHILGSMAYQAACQGRPTEAVTLIETAVAGTRSQQTPRLLAALYIRQAYAFAAMKVASAAQRRSPRPAPRSSGPRTTMTRLTCTG